MATYSLKNVCLNYFLNHDIRVSSKWAKNIKSSSELQLFNPQIPIWNILLETSTLRKKSTISSTGRDTYTPSRAKSVVRKDNLEPSGKKRKKKNKKNSCLSSLPYLPESSHLYGFISSSHSSTQQCRRSQIHHPGSDIYSASGCVQPERASTALLVENF